MSELLSLIGPLYDAALDPELWQSALAQLDTFFNTCRTLVAVEDAADPSSSYFYTSVSDPDWLRRYVQSYMLINPTRLAMVGRIKPGDIVITTDFMTPAEYSATRFAKDLLADKRIADIAVGIVEQTATRFTVLSAQRGFDHGFADETLRRKIELVLPHVQRAVKIARLFEHQKMVSSTLAETLDKLAAAVFLLTAAGGIVHANERGVAILAEADAAQSFKGKLALADKAAAAALTRALRSMFEGDTTLGGEGRAIAITTGSNRKFVATILPLDTGRRRALGSDAVVALCLKEAEFEAAPGASALVELYNLTRREMAILTALVESDGGVHEVATTMGISAATVRTHIKAIFRKTGSSRQADLVKLMAGVTGPFAPASKIKPV